MENNKPEPVVTPVTPVIPESPVVAPVTPIADVVKPAPTPGPQVFSSVYINKPVEPVKEVEVVEPVVTDAPVAPVTPVAQAPVVNPGIELPKPAEMPIQNKEVNNTVDNKPAAIPDF